MTTNAEEVNELCICITQAQEEIQNHRMNNPDQGEAGSSVTAIPPTRPALPAPPTPIEPVYRPEEYEQRDVRDMPSGACVQNKIPKKNTPLRKMEFEQIAKEGVFLNLDYINYDKYDTAIEIWSKTSFNVLENNFNWESKEIIDFLTFT